MTDDPTPRPGEPQQPDSNGYTTFESFRPTLKHAVWVLLAVVVIAFIVIAILSQVSRLPKIHWHFSPGWLVLSLIAFIAFQASQPELWRRIFRSLHGSLSAPRAWAIWCVSLLARYVPTQLLMVLSRIALAERQGVKRAVCAASIVYEFFIAVGSAIALATAFVIGLPRLEHTPLRWALLLVPIAMVIAMHPRVFGRVAMMLLRRLGRDPLPETLPFTKVLGYALLYLAAFIVEGFAVYAFARSLHPVKPGHVPILLTSYAVGYAGSVAAFFIPGGLGVRDGATAAVLSVAMPVRVAVAAAIGVRLIQTALELVSAALAEVWARRHEAVDARNSSVSRSESGVPIS
jgi:uncharacterized membrane protein YbhN (UPF0104 family)